MWEVSQLLSLSNAVIHSGTGKTAQDEFETYWTHCESDFSPNSINHLTSITLCFNWKATVFLGVSWNQPPFRSSIQQTPESLIVDCPFPQCTVTLAKKRLQIALGKDWRKANSKSSLCFMKVLLQSTWPSLHSRGCVCTLPQVWLTGQDSLLL